MFNWPFLAMPFSYGLAAAHFYLFGAWFLVIVVLFLAARRIIDPHPGPDRRKEERP